MRRSSVVMALMFLTLPVLVSAQGRAGKQAGRHNGGRLLKRLDKNGDGQISRDEWQKRPQVFDRIDQNHDGVITSDEAETAARNRAQHQGQSGRGGRALERFDKNRDGQISRDEWQGDAAVFDRLDKNHDGVITSDELPQRRHRSPDGSGSDNTPRTQPASPPRI